MIQFVQPFVDLLRLPAQREHASDYLSGLVSDLERKNIESIAYRLDQDRRNLQHFIGSAEWDPQPLFTELARQVGQELGEEDAVIVFDPSAFAKQGRQSVGGVAVRGKSITVRWPFTWPTFLEMIASWSTHDCIFPKSGRVTANA